MNSNRWRFLVGGVLVVTGLLALIGTMFDVSLTGYIWSVLFIAAGLVFLYFLFTDRKSWWASFPGFTLLGIGLLIGTAELAPRVADVIGGAFVLGGIGISFIVVYLLNRTFWWAIIPAGVMASLVVLILLEPLLGGVQGSKVSVMITLLIAGYSAWALARALGLGAVARVTRRCLAVPPGTGGYFRSALFHPWLAG